MGLVVIDPDFGSFVNKGGNGHGQTKDGASG
jgi:hypothetical protein